MSGEIEDECTHLLDLPPELLLKIMDQLDYMSRKNLSETCKYLSKLVQQFESRRNYLPPDSDEDEDDLFYSDMLNDRSRNADGNMFDDDEIDDLENFANFDQLSFGSNYDEELDDYMNGPLQEDDNDQENTP